MWRFVVAFIFMSISAPGSVAEPHSEHRRLTPDLSIETAEQREFVSYLVSCAMPEGVVLEAAHAGQDYRFEGSMGLAPDWLSRGMTATEQRWVSACLLARTNAFGKRIKISVRGTGPEVLQATPSERASHTLFEGGFFGNLFAEQPWAKSCTGKRAPVENNDAILRDRVCTERRMDGSGLTRCGFIDVGPCPATGHSEVIYVFLEPKGATAFR